MRATWLASWAGVRWVSLSAGMLACAGLALSLGGGCGGADATVFDNAHGTDGGTSGTGGSGGTANAGGAAGTSGAGGTAATGGSAGTSGTGGTAGAGGTSAGCGVDSDCTATPDTPYCDTSTGACVACEEGDPQHTCSAGLTCCGVTCVNTSNDPTHCGSCGHPCDLPNATSACSAGSCVVTSCDAGFLDCNLDAVDGCETTDGGSGCACEPGKTEACYSGAAGTEGTGPCHGGTRTCNAQGTAWGPCEGEVIPQPDTCLDQVDNDCNGVVNDGFPNVADCACIPNSTRSCYTGPAGTLNKGTCVGGTETCHPNGLGYSLCDGEVTPVIEVCGNNLDDDCNGAVDDIVDADGDGWTRCQGDCCDKAGPACANPALVNPGAFEAPNNQVDDDCDGQVDNVLAACDNGLASNSANGVDYAKAIDLCATTVENPPDISQKRWGVISATFSLADGTGNPAAVSRSIRPGFGTAITPRFGNRIAVLSTGNAADANDTNPGFAAFQGGQDTATSSAVPADWLAANGNNFPNAPGCPDPTASAGTTGFNPIMLTVRIRVPTNAQSFSLNTYFFSAEYPEWVCSPFNDFFVTLLNSNWNGQPANPADRNLAFYDPDPPGPPYYPVGVNLAFGNTGLFRQCLNGPTGCGGGAVAGTTNTCVGITELAGTGFETINPPPQFAGDPGYCGANNRLGGGTGWLTTKGNVVGGEIIQIRFAIWDTGDPWYDSVVLLDNFQWSVTPSQPGTGG